MNTKKIIRLSKQIHQQISSLKDENNTFPKIEKDILLDKIKKLYLKLSQLSETKVEKSKKEDLVAGKVIEKKEKTEVKKVREEEPKIEKMLSKTSAIKEDAVFDLFSSQSGILAEKLKSKKSSVADKIKDKTEQTNLAEKISNGKIDELKTMIGINEKFLFINELFAGSMSDYSQAIEKLDQFQEYDDVADYLMSLRSERNWTEKHPSFDKLFALIERKFK